MHLDCFRMRIARFVNRCIQLLRHRHLLIRRHFVNIVHGHHRPHFFRRFVGSGASMVRGLFIHPGF